MPLRCSDCPEVRRFTQSVRINRLDELTVDEFGDEIDRSEGWCDNDETLNTVCSECGDEAVEMDADDVEVFDRQSEDGDDLEPIRDVK